MRKTIGVKEPIPDERADLVPGTFWISSAVIAVVRTTQLILRQPQLEDSHDRIEVDESGVQLTVPVTRTFLWRVEWADVREIAAWKEDCFVYDDICVGFRAGGADGVNENHPGWSELLRELERRFGIKSPDWWVKISVPAFETKWTVLWKEPAST